jgi:hypothetical protein
MPKRPVGLSDGWQTLPYWEPQLLKYWNVLSATEKKPAAQTAAFSSREKLNGFTIANAIR